MARRNRTRSRARRDTPARHAAPTVRPEREAAPVTRLPHRGARPVRGGSARAAGAPSAQLERSALTERAFVTKDFRRLGIVVVVCVALLVVSGIAERLLLH